MVATLDVLEEFDRIHTSQEINAWRIDDEGVDQETEIIGADEARIRTYYLWSIGCHNRGEHAEYTYRSHIQNITQYLLYDFIETQENLLGWFRLFTHMYDGKSKEQGDDDDLHHIGFAEWEHGIVWKHVDYLVHECNVVYLDVVFSCWQLDEWEVALQTSGNYKTHRYGSDGGKGKIDEGSDSELTYLGNVLHRDDTCDNREHHQWYYDELEQVQEDYTKRLDVVVSNFRCALHETTCNDGQNECQKDLSCKRKFRSF